MILFFFDRSVLIDNKGFDNSSLTFDGLVDLQSAPNFLMNYWDTISYFKNIYNTINIINID